MEARKIVIVSTKTQRKDIIMSAATTLAELKADLRSNDISYEGMAFYEGTSKVELKDDNSVLPHDVPYKGTTTNELVFMLTNTEKKIKSGADLSRAEIYAVIKAENLQEECVKRFGKNFTTCKTSDLLSLINEKKDSNKEVESTTISEENHNKEVEVLKKALIKVINILYHEDMLTDREVKAIERILESDDEIDDKSSYSDDEIDEMFGFID